MSFATIHQPCRSTWKNPLTGEDEPCEPHHEQCPGSHHLEGVIGGWDCVCECHRTNPETPRKVSYLTTPEFARLNHACLLVSEAFGNFTTYLVGSVTMKDSYRDVDIRTILDDDEFDYLFKGREFFWSLTCLSIATYLREVSGLPIDYQIQRRTEANENYVAGTRNPIGKRARPYAGGGDATGFNAAPQTTSGEQPE